MRFIISIACCLAWGLVGLGCGAKANPKKSHTRLELAKNFLSNGQLEAANREAKVALTHDSENPGAYYVLGTIAYLRAVQNVQLLEVDECLTGLDAESLRAEMDTHFQEAERYYAKTVVLDPEYSEAFHNRGMIAYHLEDYEKGKTNITKALEVPHRLRSLALARADLAWVLYKSGDMPGAAKQLRQSLQFSPDLCVANYRFGRLYMERGEWDKALAKFDSVIGNTNCPMQEAHLHRINVLTKLGQGPQESDISACIALAPQSCVAAECKLGGNI